MYQWHWKTFDELSTSELYEILSIRQAVFAVEQNCVYQDVDGKDNEAWHFFAVPMLKKKPERGNTNRSTPIHAYLRVLPPGQIYREASLGRVLTTVDGRGKGLGKLLLEQALQKMAEVLPSHNIRISAQLHLKKFYSDFGFEVVSEQYMEDGIPHIEMLNSKTAEVLKHP